MLGQTARRDMHIYPNHTRRTPAEGTIAIGMGLHQSRTTAIGAIAKACNYDWLFIDMEHSARDIGTASQMMAGAKTRSDFLKNLKV
jgi:2-keto-3-deoxy-L-rhamnonate aldolase RhmA